MIVIKAKGLGFCEGGRNCINRAIEIASLGEPVYVFGPLLHNKSVLKNLETLGVHSIEPDPETKAKGKLLIRAHGISDKLKQKLVKNNDLVDLTCPKVYKIHSLTKLYENQGYHIIYFGKPGHPETEGTLGNLEDYTIVTSLEDAKKVKKKRVALIAQSTCSHEEFERIADYIRKREGSLIFDTICNSTKERQAHSKQLSKKVDLMVVLGGRNSSNTKELHKICIKNCNTIWLATPEEIENYLHEICSAETIGLTAGASTPDEDIEKLYNWLLKLNKTYKPN